MQSLSKYQVHFHGTGTNNSNIYVEIQKTPNNQSNIDKKKNTAGGIILLDFKLYYKAIRIKMYGTGTKLDTQINRAD